MFCGECGAQNPDTNQFCRNCGKPLAHRPAAAAAASPATPPAAPGFPAAPSQPVPAPAVPQQAAAAGAAVPATATGRRWNWLGIVSIVPGLLSLVILPLILASAAILLGIAGIVLFRRSTGRIGFASPVGILLGILTIAIKVLVG